MAISAKAASGVWIVATAVWISIHSVTAVQVGSIAKIDPALLEARARQGDVTYLVLLNERADLSAAPTIADRDSRGWFVYRALRDVAARTQKPLLDQLTAEQRGGRVRQVKSFFAVNAIGVTSAAEILTRLAEFPEVDRIVLAPIVRIPPPLAGTPEPTVQSIEWNIARIRAPEVWAAGAQGQGIVVANIDTGVQFDHPALVNQYRGSLGAGTFDHDYNWWDPAGACGSPSLAPCDNDGHGTHTMGTMVGSDGGANQIGVAPEARWIACQACPGGFCNLFTLLACGDWMLAPTDLSGLNADPGKRPHVINNSWGFIFGGLPFYRPMVSAWRAAGIFPAFSAGNSGPGCGTAISPGDYPESFSAGAVDVNDQIASFSSRGPSAFSSITKPDVSAPGVNIRSSVPGGGYQSFSGTSMASPHVAGTVALLWSRFPSLARDIGNTEKKLRPASAILNSTEACGGSGPTSHPNNTFGWGLEDALRASMAFNIYTDRSVYGAGDTMNVTMSLLSPMNSSTNVDFYIGLQVPGGAPFLLAPPAGGTIPPSVELFELPLLSYTFTGSEPPGAYLFFTLLTAQGTSNILSQDVAPFMKP